MKILPPRTWLFTILLLGWVTCAFGEFKAGIAVRVVTPDPLLPVSGGIGPSDPVKEKKGDLSVRALVLVQGDTKLAIVSTDSVSYTHLTLPTICSV